MYDDPVFVQLTREYLEYLKSRLDEILEQHLPKGNFQEIRQYGHNEKGTGGGYGFDEFTDIGKAIEFAGRDKKKESLEKLLPEFQQMLEKTLSKI